MLKTRVSVETKKIKMANSVGPDEMVHNEPSHLDLHCLHSLGLQDYKGYMYVNPCHAE